jgi:soluble lytic murein transglycosylase-like protein
VKALGISALAAALAWHPAAEAEDAAAGFRLKLEDAGAYRLQLADPHAFHLANDKVAAVEAAQLPAALSSRPYARLIEAAAREAALDPALVHALIYIESGYNPKARSAKGAIGLMQVLPETAARYGVANIAHSPVANLRAGTRYLSDLLKMFDCRLDLALAAYNAGEKTVLRYGMRIPPFAETKAYVPAVMAKFDEWRHRPPVAMTGARVRVQYASGARGEAAPAAAPLQERRMLACTS